MFEHEDVQVYSMEEVPLDRDVFLMGQEWMAAYEAALLRMLAGGEYEYIGYISYACVRAVRSNSLEISWYPNIFDRHHEVRVTLPRSEFVTCTGCWSYDEKPRIFVTDEWLRDLHLRAYSVFALVDAIGVREALASGAITDGKLLKLQQMLDDVAARSPETSLVSFADSLLLKTNWSVGQHDVELGYTYEPERVFPTLAEIRDAYKDALGLPIYAVITQGRNEFYGNQLMHTAASGNHVSLNSLGLPFAQLMAIETAAKSAAKRGEHEFAEIYMDENFFRSLKWDFEFDKSKRLKFPYRAPMADWPCEYVLGSFQMAEDWLRPERDRDFHKRQKGRPRVPGGL